MYFNKEFPHVFVYCFSCRYLAQLGLPQLGLPVPKIKGRELGPLSTVKQVAQTPQPLDWAGEPPPPVVKGVALSGLFLWSPFAATFAICLGWYRIYSSSLEIRKKYEKIQNPPSPVGPQKYKKKLKNYKRGHFLAILYIFSFVFFSFLDFSGPAREGGFCIFCFFFFVVFPGLRGSCILYHPRKISRLLENNLKNKRDGAVRRKFRERRGKGGVVENSGEGKKHAIELLRRHHLIV